MMADVSIKVQHSKRFIPLAGGRLPWDTTQSTLLKLIAAQLQVNVDDIELIPVGKNPSTLDRETALFAAASSAAEDNPYLTLNELVGGNQTPGAFFLVRLSAGVGAAAPPPPPVTPAALLAPAAGGGKGRAIDAEIGQLIHAHKDVVASVTELIEPLLRAAHAVVYGPPSAAPSPPDRPWLPLVHVALWTSESKAIVPSAVYAAQIGGDGGGGPGGPFLPDGAPATDSNFMQFCIFSGLETRALTLSDVTSTVVKVGQDAVGRVNLSSLEPAILLNALRYFPLSRFSSDRNAARCEHVGRIFERQCLLSSFPGDAALDELAAAVGVPPPFRPPSRSVAFASNSLRSFLHDVLRHDVSPAYWTSTDLQTFALLAAAFAVQVAAQWVTWKSGPPQGCVAPDAFPLQAECDSNKAVALGAARALGAVFMRLRGTSGPAPLPLTDPAGFSLAARLQEAVGIGVTARDRGHGPLRVLIAMPHAPSTPPAGALVAAAWDVIVDFSDDATFIVPSDDTGGAEEAKLDAAVGATGAAGAARSKPAVWRSLSAEMAMSARVMHSAHVATGPDVVARGEFFVARDTQPGSWNGGIRDVRSGLRSRIFAPLSLGPSRSPLTERGVITKAGSFACNKMEALATAINARRDEQGWRVQVTVLAYAPYFIGEKPYNFNLWAFPRFCGVREPKYDFDAPLLAQALLAKLSTDSTDVLVLHDVSPLHAHPDFSWLATGLVARQAVRELFLPSDRLQVHALMCAPSDADFADSIRIPGHHPGEWVLLVRPSNSSSPAALLRQSTFAFNVLAGAGVQVLHKHLLEMSLPQLSPGGNSGASDLLARLRDAAVDFLAHRSTAWALLDEGFVADAGFEHPVVMRRARQQVQLDEALRATVGDAQDRGTACLIIAHERLSGATTLARRTLLRWAYGSSNGGSGNVCAVLGSEWDPASTDAVRAIEYLETAFMTSRRPLVVLADRNVTETAATSFRNAVAARNIRLVLVRVTLKSSAGWGDRIICVDKPRREDFSEVEAAWLNVRRLLSTRASGASFGGLTDADCTGPRHPQQPSPGGYAGRAVRKTSNWKNLPLDSFLLVHPFALFADDDDNEVKQRLSATITSITERLFEAAAVGGPRRGSLRLLAYLALLQCASSCANAQDSRDAPPVLLAPLANGVLDDSAEHSELNVSGAEARKALFEMTQQNLLHKIDMFGSGHSASAAAGGGRAAQRHEPAAVRTQTQAMHSRVGDAAASHSEHGGLSGLLAELVLLHRLYVRPSDGDRVEMREAVFPRTSASASFHRGAGARLVQTASKQVERMVSLRSATSPPATLPLPGTLADAAVIEPTTRTMRQLQVELESHTTIAMPDGDAVAWDQLVFRSPNPGAVVFYPLLAPIFLRRYFELEAETAAAVVGGGGESFNPVLSLTLSLLHFVARHHDDVLRDVATDDALLSTTDRRSSALSEMHPVRALLHALGERNAHLRLSLARHERHHRNHFSALVVAVVPGGYTVEAQQHPPLWIVTGDAAATPVLKPGEPTMGKLVDISVARELLFYSFSVFHSLRLRREVCRLQIPDMEIAVRAALDLAKSRKQSLTASLSLPSVVIDDAALATVAVAAVAATHARNVVRDLLGASSAMDLDVAGNSDYFLISVATLIGQLHLSCVGADYLGVLSSRSVGVPLARYAFEHELRDIEAFVCSAQRSFRAERNAAPGPKKHEASAYAACNETRLLEVLWDRLEYLYAVCCWLDAHVSPVNAATATFLENQKFEWWNITPSTHVPASAAAVLVGPEVSTFSAESACHERLTVLCAELLDMLLRHNEDLNENQLVVSCQSAVSALVRIALVSAGMSKKAHGDVRVARKRLREKIENKILHVEELDRDGGDVDGRAARMLEWYRREYVAIARVSFSMPDASVARGTLPHGKRPSTYELCQSLRCFALCLDDTNGPEIVNKALRPEVDFLVHRCLLPLTKRRATAAAAGAMNQEKFEAAARNDAYALFCVVAPFSRRSYNPSLKEQRGAVVPPAFSAPLYSVAQVLSVADEWARDGGAHAPLWRAMLLAQLAWEGAATRAQVDALRTLVGNFAGDPAVAAAGGAASGHQDALERLGWTRGALRAPAVISAVAAHPGHMLSQYFEFALASMSGSKLLSPLPDGDIPLGWRPQFSRSEEVAVLDPLHPFACRVLHGTLVDMKQTSQSHYVGVVRLSVNIVGEESADASDAGAAGADDESDDDDEGRAPSSASPSADFYLPLRFKSDEFEGLKRACPPREPRIGLGVTAFLRAGPYPVDGVTSGFELSLRWPQLDIDGRHRRITPITFSANVAVHRDELGEFTNPSVTEESPDVECNDAADAADASIPAVSTTAECTPSKLVASVPIQGSGAAPQDLVSAGSQRAAPPAPAAAAAATLRLAERDAFPLWQLAALQELLSDGTGTPIMLHSPILVDNLVDTSSASARPEKIRFSFYDFHTMQPDHSSRPPPLTRHTYAALSLSFLAKKTQKKLGQGRCAQSLTDAGAFVYDYHLMRKSPATVAMLADYSVVVALPEWSLVSAGDGIYVVRGRFVFASGPASRSDSFLVPANRAGVHLLAFPRGSGHENVRNAVAALHHSVVSSLFGLIADRSSVPPALVGVAKKYGIAKQALGWSPIEGYPHGLTSGGVGGAGGPPK